MPLTGPPAVDFYSQLSGLGDVLQQNAKLAQQNQLMQNRKDAFSSFTALDPNSPDYGKQSMTIAQKLGSNGDPDGAMKFITIAQTAADKARQAQRDAVSDQHWSITNSRAAAAESRAAAEYENTPDQYNPNPRAAEPGQPKFIDQYAQAKAAADASAPGGGGLSLTPIYGKDKDGNTVLLQPGKDGVAVQSKLPEGVTLNGYDNETIAADAKALNSGDPNILKKYSNKGQGRVDLLRLGNEANRQRVANGQDPIDITQNYITTQGDVARERASGNMEGRMAPAAVEAQGAFKIAREASDNLSRTSFVPYNKILQAGQAAFSNPQLKAAATAYNTAVMTYSRAVSPTGVGSVTAQEHARQILETADGPEATKAAFDQLDREVAMAHASPGQARAGFKADRSARMNPQGQPVSQPVRATNAAGQVLVLDHVRNMWVPESGATQ